MLPPSLMGLLPLLFLPERGYKETRNVAFCHFKLEGEKRQKTKVGYEEMVGCGEMRQKCHF